MIFRALGLSALLLPLSLPALANELAAVLDWSQRVTLSTPVSGVIEKVNVEPGQTVRQGEVLLALNTLQLQAQVLEQRADVERLAESEADARRELERVQELYARTVSSTTELDAAKLRLVRMTAQLAAARARLEVARRQLEDSELRAPLAAVILNRQAEPGQVVASQWQPPALMTLARAEELLARAEVSPERVARIKLGQRATVSVAGRSLAGQVRSVSVDATGRYSLAVVFARPPEWVAGMTASIQLH